MEFANDIMKLQAKRENEFTKFRYDELDHYEEGKRVLKSIFKTCILERKFSKDITMHDLAVLAFFRLQPRVSLRSMPSIDLLTRFYEDKLEGEELRLATESIETWDKIIDMTKTNIEDVMTKKSIRRLWCEGKLKDPDFKGFEGFKCKEVYDLWLNDRNALLEDNRYFRKLWDASTKSRLIWAYSTETLLIQISCAAGMIEDQTRKVAMKVSNTSNFYNPYDMIVSANAMTKSQWGKKITNMCKPRDLSKDIIGLDNNSKYTYLMHQGDAKGWDQHFTQWELLFIIVFMCTTTDISRRKTKLGKPNRFTILDLALYETFQPAIMPFKGKVALNAQLSSGSLFTLTGNNICNLVHNEYAFMQLTMGNLSAYDNDCFVNGDNFLASLFLEIEEGKICKLYDYNDYIEIHSLFGHELHNVTDTVYQTKSFDPIEFSGYLFKPARINEYKEKYVYRPYRDEQQQAIAMCLTERAQLVEKYGTTFTATMLYRSMSTTGNIVNGASNIFKWLLRFDPVFHYLMNKIKSQEIDPDSVKLIVYDQTGQDIEATAKITDYLYGLTTNESRDIHGIHAKYFYGLPQIAKGFSIQKQIAWRDTQIKHKLKTHYTVHCVDEFGNFLYSKYGYKKGKPITSRIRYESLRGLTEDITTKSEAKQLAINLTMDMLQGFISPNTIRGYLNSNVIKPKGLNDTTLYKEINDKETYSEITRIINKLRG